MYPDDDAVSTPKGDGRISSTIVQFVLAGGLSQVFVEWGDVIPPDLQTEFFVLIAFLLTWLMSYADSHGIPYPGQKMLGRVKDE